MLDTMVVFQSPNGRTEPLGMENGGTGVTTPTTDTWHSMPRTGSVAWTKPPLAMIAEGSRDSTLI